MDSQSSLIATLFEKTEHYAKSSAELYKLKVIDTSADVISTLTARLAVIVVFTVFFLTLNIGFALFIGELLGKAYFGFFIVAGGYGLMGIIFYVFRNKWIKEPMRNSIITQALN